MVPALINVTTNGCIATHVEVASTRRARRRGLLGRDRMESGSALMLVPCWAVHTAFMKFPIDVIFVDREGRAVRVVEALRPWRAAAAIRAQSVIELPAGTLARGAVFIGDRVSVVPAEMEAPHWAEARAW